MSIPVINADEQQNAIVLEAPGPFILELSEVSTAGYVWEVLSIEPDGMLQVISSELLLNPQSKECGGKNKRRFYFHVTSPGNIVLCMQLKRCWEAASHEVIHFNIVCK